MVSPEFGYLSTQRFFFVGEGSLLDLEHEGFLDLQSQGIVQPLYLSDVSGLLLLKRLKLIDSLLVVIEDFVQPFNLVAQFHDFQLILVQTLDLKGFDVIPALEL